MSSPNSPSARRRTERVFGAEAPSAQPSPPAAPQPQPAPEGRPIRFIREIGVRARLRIYWDRIRIGEDGVGVWQHDCPTGGVHNAFRHLGDAATWGTFGKPEDYVDWPTACADCGAPVPTESWGESYRDKPAGADGIFLCRQVFEKRLYDSPSGSPEPLDIFWRACRLDPGDHCWNWDNCSGQHLYAVCPNGHEWNIDGRASNCGSPEERTHRCWVRHGSPEGGMLHVDKSGHTCNAGGGSIQAGDYHGHLHHGRFVP